jgi:hypothetical protein
MLALLRAGDRRQAGDGNLITRMLLADSVQLCIELLDHRQDLARIEDRAPCPKPPPHPDRPR